MKTLVQFIVVVVALFSSFEVRGANLGIDINHPENSRFYQNLNDAERQIFLETFHPIARLATAKKLQTAQYYLDPPMEIEGLGSETNCLEYCAKDSDVLFVGLYQTNNSGIHYHTNLAVFASVSGIKEMNELMRSKLVVIANRTLTSSTADKNQPFEFFSYTLGTTHNAEINLDRLLLSQAFSFVKVNGDYQIPDLSQYSLGLDHIIEFEFVNANWFRIEVTNFTSSVQLVFDTRVNTPEDGTFAAASTDTHLVAIKTDIITSGTNGPTRLKNYVGWQSSSSFTLRIYGEYGKHVEERPLVLDNLRVSEGSFLLDTVGETGRMGTLMWSPCANGPWTDLGTNIVIRPFGQIRTVQFTAPNANVGIYQVRVLDRLAPWIVD